MLRILGLIALISTSHATIEANSDKGVVFTPAQKAEVTKLIETYLKTNPQEIIKSLENYGKEQQVNAIKKLEGNATAAKDKLLDSTNAIVIGKADAAAKLIIFLDPNCGHCRGVSDLVSQATASIEGKNVAILIRQWPILGPDSEFISAALIALYKKDAKKYKELSEKIVATQKQLNKDTFLTIVKDAGIDPASLEKDAANAAKLLENTKELATQIGLEGTPTAFLSDKSGIHFVQIGNKESFVKLLNDAVKA